MRVLVHRQKHRMSWISMATKMRIPTKVMVEMRERRKEKQKKMEWEEYRKGKIRERKREKRGKQWCLLEIIFDCDA